MYESVRIPKIIMQTWKDHNIPLKWKSSRDSIFTHMKDWKYVLMTDEDNRNFVEKHFPDFLSYYDNFEYNIQRVDAIRYMWLYVHGGIYMDLDFELLKPIDDFFKTDSDLYLVSSGNIPTYITNSFMASKPGSNIWLDVIEHMKKPSPFYRFGKHMRVMMTTGPIMLTNVISKYGYSYTRLPKAKFNPCSVCNIHCNTDDAFMRPLEGSSWIGLDTRIYNYFMCNWKSFSIIITVLIFLIIIGLILYIYYHGLFKFR